MEFKSVNLGNQTNFELQVNTLKDALNSNSEALVLYKACRDLTLTLGDLARVGSELSDTKISKGRALFQLAIESLPNSTERREAVRKYGIYEYFSEVLEEADATLVAKEKIVSLPISLKDPVNLADLFSEFEIQASKLDSISGPVIDVIMQVRGYLDYAKLEGQKSLGSQSLNLLDYFNNGLRVYVPNSTTLRNQEFEEGFNASTRSVFKQIQKKLAA